MNAEGLEVVSFVLAAEDAMPGVVRAVLQRDGPARDEPVGHGLGTIEVGEQQRIVRTALADVELTGRRIVSPNQPVNKR